MAIDPVAQRISSGLATGTAGANRVNSSGDGPEGAAKTDADALRLELSTKPGRDSATRAVGDANWDAASSARFFASPEGDSLLRHLANRTAARPSLDVRL